MASVLVVDDEEGIRAFLADALEADGHTVTQAGHGKEALARLGEGTFQVLITDLGMPIMGGLELLRAVRRDHPEVEVIVLTAHGSIESALETMREGAFDYLQKPVASPEALRRLVARAAERHLLEPERHELE
jgi:two-component system response regulator FlrC